MNLKRLSLLMLVLVAAAALVACGPGDTSRTGSTDWPEACETGPWPTASCRIRNSNWA